MINDTVDKIVEFVDSSPIILWSLMITSVVLPMLEWEGYINIGLFSLIPLGIMTLIGVGLYMLSAHMVRRFNKEEG